MLHTSFYMAPEHQYAHKKRWNASKKSDLRKLTLSLQGSCSSSTSTTPPSSARNVSTRPGCSRHIASSDWPASIDLAARSAVWGCPTSPVLRPYPCRQMAIRRRTWRHISLLFKKTDVLHRSIAYRSRRLASFLSFLKQASQG